MLEILRSWYVRHFSNPEAFMLAFLLLLGFGIVILFGEMLAPIIASIVIAYLLEGVVSWLIRAGSLRFPAVILVYLAFIALLLVTLFGLLPLLSRQLTQLIQDLPLMITEWQNSLQRLPQAYPQIISEVQMNEVMGHIRGELASFGQYILSYSLSSIIGLFTILVYLVLMPLLVFFFLKDKEQIIHWVSGYMPRARGLANQVWDEVDAQIGNYIRGKFWEIMVVWAACFITFSLMGLKFSLLLSFLVGISVLIPYVGAVVVTLPVMLVAYSQWGLDVDFWYVMIAYLVIQGLDGSVLVPLLFSEVVNLHPIAIITAVLVFGGIWGFWGVFFAIPLATLVQAVLHAWPRAPDEPDATNPVS